MKISKVLSFSTCSFTLAFGCGGTVETIEDYGSGGWIGSGGRLAGATGGSLVAAGGSGLGAAPASGGLLGAGGWQSSGGGVPTGTGGTFIPPLPGGGRPGAGGQSAAGGRSGAAGGAAPGVGGGFTGGAPNTSSGGAPTSGGGGAASGGTPGSGGALGCEAEDVWGDGQYCEAWGECEGRPIWSYCDGSHCSCEGTWGAIELELNGNFGSERCSEMLAICNSPAVNDPGSNATCEREYVEQSRQNCSIGTRCSKELMVDGGTANLLTWRNVYCDKSGDTWSCNCSGGASNVRFDFSADVDSSSLCEDVDTNVCDGSPIEVVGETSCVPSYQSASRDWCDIELECTAPAVVNEVEGRLFQDYRYAYCETAAEGEFYCSCDSRDQFVVSAASAWDACSDLSEMCSGL